MHMPCSGHGIRKSRTLPARVGEKLIAVFIGDRLNQDHFPADATNAQKLSGEWECVVGFAVPSEPYVPVDIGENNRLSISHIDGRTQEGVYHNGSIMTDAGLIDVQTLEIGTGIEILEPASATVSMMAARGEPATAPAHLQG